MRQLAAYFVCQIWNKNLLSLTAGFMKYKLNAGGSCQKASSCQSNFEGWGGSKDSLCVLLVISFTSDFVNKMPALTHSLYFVKLLALEGHSMLEEDYFEY